jgi:hypothetical protein
MLGPHKPFWASDTRGSRRICRVAETGPKRLGTAHASRALVPKVCQNAIVFDRFGLVSSEGYIPQVDENTEKARWLFAALESAVTRRRRAHYQPCIQSRELALATIHNLHALSGAYELNSECQAQQIRYVAGPRNLNFFWIKNFGRPCNQPILYA